MTPEDAYSILEAIAEINGYMHRLKKWKATAAEREDEELAQEISEQHQELLSPFAFSKCNIAVGEQIEFCCAGNKHSGETCTVYDDKYVKYNGQIWSLSALAKYLNGRKTEVQGPRNFKYKDENLNDIQHRIGV